VHFAERSGSGTPGQWCPIVNRRAISALPAAGWFGEVFMSVCLVIRDGPARELATATPPAATPPAATPRSTPHIRRSRAAAMSKARRSKPRSMPATPRSASNACSTPESPRVSVRENRAYARFSGRAKSAPIASNRLISCWSCAGGKRPSGSTNPGRVSCALRRTIELVTVHRKSRDDVRKNWCHAVGVVRVRGHGPGSGDSAAGDRARRFGVTTIRILVPQHQLVRLIA
jgi:hypothetical protein